ncbi:Glutamate--tRNA ligase [uncultured archaeon]|nr:Glutamate--tRNA ligase [uncultured archaeon]
MRQPVKLTVEGAPAKEAVLKNHPTKKEMGERKLAAVNTFWIPGADADALIVTELFRLKELYNVTVTSKNADGLVGKYEADEGIAAKKIQWVPVESAVACKVKKAGDLLDEKGAYRADSLSEEAGYCEPSCRELADSAVVQFERYGYARLDKKEEHGLVFIFSC